MPLRCNQILPTNIKPVSKAWFQTCTYHKLIIPKEIPILHLALKVKSNQLAQIENRGNNQGKIVCFKMSLFAQNLFFYLFFIISKIRRSLPKEKLKWNINNMLCLPVSQLYQQKSWIQLKSTKIRWPWLSVPRKNHRRIVSECNDLEKLLRTSGSSSHRDLAALLLDIRLCIRHWSV